MALLITWVVLCVSLIGTISAAPVKQQSDLDLHTGAKLQSNQMMSALISTMLRNLFSSFGPTRHDQGYDHAKLQSNDAEFSGSILKNLLGYLISANNEANVQTGLANRVDYKGAMIEAIDNLPTEAKAEFFENLLGGGLFSG